MRKEKQKTDALTLEPWEICLCILEVGDFLLPRVECHGVDQIPKPNVCAGESNGRGVVECGEDHEKYIVREENDAHSSLLEPPPALFSARSFHFSSPSPRWLRCCSLPLSSGAKWSMMGEMCRVVVERLVALDAM